MLLTLLPSFNIHALCRIGSSAVNSEETSNFTEANCSFSFDQDKHRASSFYKAFALKYLLYGHDYALKCRSLMES
jgi:hypothetical protein